MSAFRTLLLASVMLPALHAGQALAQAAPETVEPQSAAIETVIVTARRSEESAQTVPVAVSAFSETRLNNLGGDNIGALQGSVPNLNIVQGRGSSSSANIYIRGIGQPDALASFDPAVGVYVDDVYISRIRGALVDTFDTQRIEVLRGPQGTLYGKNTIGGALKIITAKPSNTFRAQVRAVYGDYNERELAARISGPLMGDVLTGSLSAMTSQRDGYVSDPINPSREYNDKDTQAIRGQLSFSPTETFNLLLAADFTQESPSMTVGRQEALLFRLNNFATPAVLQLAPAAGSVWNYQTSTSTDLPNRLELEHAGASATATWDINEALTLKSITAARKLDYEDYIDIDATPFSLGDVFVGVRQEQVSQELQLNFDNGGPVKIVSGLYFLEETIESTQFALANDLFRIGVTPTVPNGLAFGFRRDVKDKLDLSSFAFYANATADFSEKLSATLGVRYTEETKDYAIDNRTSLGAVLVSQQTVTFDALNPSIGVDYKFSDNAFGYAKISSGFKSGGINGRAATALEAIPYEPESVVSYEAGLKADFMNKRLRTNWAVFYNDYTNFQARVSDADPLNPANIALTVLNAGKMETRGAELEAIWNPINPLVLTAELGYLKARYDTFVDRRATNADRSWQTPAFSPEYTYRFGGAYEFDLGGVGELTFGVDASFRSESALAVDNANLTTRVRFPGVWQDDFWVYNARLVWTSEDGRYSAALHGKNLSDEVYKTDAQEFSAVGGIQTAYYGAPQTWRVQLTAKY